MDSLVDSRLKNTRKAAHQCYMPISCPFSRCCRVVTMTQGSWTYSVPISPELVKIPDRFPSSAGLYHLNKHDTDMDSLSDREPQNNTVEGVGCSRAEDIMCSYERRRLRDTLQKANGIHLLNARDSARAKKSICIVVSLSQRHHNDRPSERVHVLFATTYLNVRTPQRICIDGSQIRGDTV